MAEGLTAADLAGAPTNAGLTPGDLAAAPGPQAPVHQSYIAGLARSLIGQGMLFGWGDEIMGRLRELSGEKYETARNDERAKVADFRKENPKTALASEVGGGFLTPGLGLLGGGLKATTTFGRVAQGVGVGAGIGAIAGAGASDTGALEGATQGAKLGAVVGPLAPLAGRAVGSAVNHGAELLGPTFARLGAKMPGSLSTPAEAAADSVMAREMRAGNVTPQQLRDELAKADRARTFHGGVGAPNASEAQSPLGLVDLSPTLQKLGGSVARASPNAASRAEAFIGTRQTGVEPSTDAARAFATEGGLEFRNPLSIPPKNAVLESPAGQHERYRGGLQRAYTLADKDFHGFAENAYLTEQNLRQAMKIKENQLYGDFRTAQKGYDVRPDIQPVIAKWTAKLSDPETQVDEGNIIRQALRAFTSDGKDWVKSVDAIDKGKRALDAKISIAQQQGNANKVRLLKGVQVDFVSAADNIQAKDIGKKWAAAREYSSGERQRMDALQWGRDAPKADSHATSDQFAVFPEDQKKLARLGILEGITNIGADKRRANDMSLIFDTNRMQNLLRETIPRSDKTGAVYNTRPEMFGDYISNEKLMVGTRDKVLGNSATASRLADDERLTRQTLSQMFDRFKQGGVGVVPLALEAASAGLTKIFGFREDVAQEIGRRLFTADSGQREAIIQRLEAQWGKDKVGTFTRFLDHIAGSGAIGLPATGGRMIGDSKK